MANMMDYIQWRGDLTFSERPFNEVDGLIFAELSYVDYSNIVPNTVVEGITLKRAAEEYFLKYPDSRGRLGIVVPDSIHDLLRAAGNSERFGSVVLSGYTAETSEEKEEQFSAVTFTIENRIRCIAFRGTDDTIVGWKENFNMCYMFPVPAQSDAANYLNMVAADWNKDLIITGHSKGGNLAVYAAAYCLPEAQEHITAVYNFDGPGFPTSQITLENYSRIRGLMTTLLPEADIVGILLDHEDQYHAVKSNAVGVWQHDGFSWELMGTKFIYSEDIKSSSKRKDKTLRAWVDDMDMELREQFVNKLFSFCKSTDARTLTDLKRDPIGLMNAINGAFEDEETREVLKRSLSMLLSEDKTHRYAAAQDSLMRIKGKVTEKAALAIKIKK